ncbi:ABC transporter substrate-binding protein [Litoreibacter albidus]|uniref:Probable sugar-binding periplasmic protein n=1 Tax=Litoreibacter albidus TaxID=670155 RepID=A0A1H3CST0_9RHOB|nr:ABC transporter substrate-binding protein [Litoreibacter albidus]SDX57302.1 glucose/mannose transport system substrate-binding protein [Litoreibacter albidus]
MKTKAIRNVSGAAMMSAVLAGGAHAEPTLEVLHYWTSGGESLAINVFADALNNAGGKWVDQPVAGGGGDAMNTVLRTRVIAGDPPGMTILKGPVVTEWANAGALADLENVAAAEKWDDILPPLLSDIVKVDGKYAAVPLDVHRVDWMWVNPEVLASVDGAVPTTWDEFNTLADKLLEAGITPLAHGGQPWQDATMFEVVALGLGGPDFFREALVDVNPDALRSDTMIAVFDQMRRMRGYVDDNFSGRDWNLATTMVMNGDAAMQIMGDWAKGEFLAANKTPGEDFICAPAPNKGGYILNSNSFAFFDDPNASDDAVAGRELMASLLLSEEAQIEFTLNKGSVPARLGVSREPYDICGVRSMDDIEATLASGTLVPSMAHEMATSSANRGAFLEIITEHFNSDMSSQEAVELLVEAIELAQ